MNRLIQWVYDRLLVPGAANYDAMVRGTFCGILPALAIMAAAKIGKSVLDGRSKRQAHSASKEAFDKTEEARLEAAKAGHADTERGRIARATGISNKLAGTKYDIDPAMLEEAMKERAFTGYKREAPEVTGSGWNDLAKAGIEQAGNMASAYIAGQDPAAVGGGGGIQPAGVTPFNPKLGQGMFQAPSNCPPGTIC